MGKGKGFRFITSSAILFIIAVLCVILFYTCSLEYNASKPVEEPVAEPVIIQEPVVEPVVEEPVLEVEVPEPEAEPEPVVEQIVEEVPVEETAEPEPAVEPEPVTEAIPQAPDLDWFVYTSANASQNDYSGSFWEDEIDWSEFVFSDEEIALPDGTYYATLYVNDTAYGSIQFEQRNEVPLFLRSDLETELNGTLATDYYYIFFQDESEYYGIEYLESMARSVVYDSTNLVLKLYFTSSQVPLQTLSMGSSAYSLLRQNYDVIGNVVVEPAKFSLQSNISLFLSIQSTRDMLTSINASMSLSNTFSFWNMTFGLPISLSYSKGAGLIPSIGNWNGYLDFPNNNLRLSFGNVGNSGFRSGTPFGITLEKNYGYGTGSAMNNQYAQIITLVEDSTVIIKVNGNVVYTKTLGLGEYRLTDFAFVQGSNDIEVQIHPVANGSDTSGDQVLTFSQNYDTSLLAKGESTWRLGVSIPKVSQVAGSADSDPFGFVVPALPKYSPYTGLSRMENSYNLSAFSVFWDQTVGITHEYTQSHSFSFIFEKNTNSGSAPSEYSAVFGATVSGTLATSIGTTRSTFNGLLDTATPSRNSMSINLSQSFANEYLKALSLSGSYQITPSAQTIALNTGYSWSIQRTRISLSVSSSYKFKTTESSPDIDKPLSLNGSLSLSSTFGKNISFSLSSSINQDLMFYATASLSFSIGKTQSVNTSASSSTGRPVTGNIGWSYRASSTSRSSYQVNMSNINFTDIRNHILSATWSRSGDIVGMSLRTQASNNYTRFSTTLSLNTALAFADGEFAMANSMYGPFLLISPEGNLKKASISVASATDSSAATAKKVFGNVLYNRLSMYKNNNVVVYASNGSLFSSAGSFLFKITPVARQGFLARVHLEASIAVSGVLRRDSDLVYDSYSSPIYKVTLDENGTDVSSIEIDSSSYFFTDIDGRFILSDLSAGIYMIDLESNGEWYAAFFEIPTSEQAGYVALYKDYNAENLLGQDVTEKYNIKSFDDSYAGSIYLEPDRLITEEEYWDLLFSIQMDSYETENWDFEDEEDMMVYQMVTNSAL